MADGEIYNLLLCCGLMLVLKSTCQLLKHTKRRDEQTDSPTDCFITFAMSVITPMFIMAKPKCFYI